MAKAAKVAEVSMNDEADDESMISFSEDLSDAEAPLPLPERDYPATITDAARHHTQDGRPMIKTTWKINEEDFPVDFDPGMAPGGKTITHFLMADDTPASRFRVRRFRRLLRQLGRARSEFRVLGEFSHLVVALETGGLPNPFGIHREFPEVVVGVAVLLTPLLSDVGRIGSMRRVLEARP